MVEEKIFSIDDNFFQRANIYNIAELAEIGKCEIYPINAKLDLQINGLAPIEKAKNAELSFIADKKYLKYLGQTKASACIIQKSIISELNSELIFLTSDNVYKSYALIASYMYKSREIDIDKRNLSYISETAKIGKNVKIEPFSYIGSEASIGDNVVIKSNSYIGDKVTIGENSYIATGTVIRYAIIGKNVILHPGVKIGQDGFGFATDSKGHLRIPQLGRVIIEDDVNIGSNSCIDRGSVLDTFIGQGTQIDNLVQIGHNVQIGKYCVIVSQVGIAGSTKIGDFTTIAGQVGIAGHLNIGKKVQIAAKSGVTKDIADFQIVAGMPAMPVNEWRRKNAMLNILMKKRHNANNEEKA